MVLVLNNCCSSGQPYEDDRLGAIFIGLLRQTFLDLIVSRLIEAKSGVNEVWLSRQLMTLATSWFLLCTTVYLQII